MLNRIQREVDPGLALVGLDISDTAIRRGRKIHRGLNLVCADGSQTPFEDSSFDALVSYGSYEHFPDPRRGLREAARILKPGSCFLTMMPALGVDRLDRNDEGWYEERGVPGSPVRQMQWNWKRATWEAAFEHAGLTLFESTGPSRFGALKPGVFFFGQKS